MIEKVEKEFNIYRMHGSPREWFLDKMMKSPRQKEIDHIITAPPNACTINSPVQYV